MTLTNDEREPGMLDAVLAQLFNSDTEEEEMRDSWTGNELKK